ncbi:hypothetical protein CDPG_00002 [Cellulophaga phage phi47:1]|nr:hypothetical protein CDPG_00002 [Cellulophaga phage phi47:1]
MGKALVAATLVMKDASAGKVYFVEQIVEEINDEILAKIEEGSTVEEEEETENEPTLVESLSEMTKKELKEFINDDPALSEISVKGLETDEIVKLIVDALESVEAEEEAEAEEAGGA